jgi:uncharacterized protein with von Willebrand factor type A (vWA) domain
MDKDSEATAQALQRATIDELIQNRKGDIFTRNYVSQAKPEEVLGVIISQYNEWNIKSIIDTFLYALEDSNAHELVEKISKITNRDI